MENYHKMSDEMQVVLDKVFEIISSLNLLDGDIEKVGELIETARSKYNDIKDTGILFLTEDAGNEDGSFTDFMEMLEHTINYEKNLSLCGKPDCKETCMVEPLHNEGSDYKGCWNQSF